MFFFLFHRSFIVFSETNGDPNTGGGGGGAERSKPIGGSGGSGVVYVRRMPVSLGEGELGDISRTVMDLEKIRSYAR